MGRVTGDHVGSPLQGDNEIRTAKFQFCILPFAFCISVQRTDKLQFEFNKSKIPKESTFPVHCPLSTVH